MTDVKTILDMIETVDPSDTAKLDEIDCRVYCYLENRGQPNLYYIINWRNDINGYAHLCQYTRSRDALKAIRPEGWIFNIEHVPEDGISYCVAFHYDPDEKELYSYFPGRALPTEELAELHSILQAIAYERGEHL